MWAVSRSRVGSFTTTMAYTSAMTAWCSSRASSGTSLAQASMRSRWSASVSVGCRKSSTTPTCASRRNAAASGLPAERIVARARCLVETSLAVCTTCSAATARRSRSGASAAGPRACNGSGSRWHGLGIGLIKPWCSLCGRDAAPHHGNQAKFLSESRSDLHCCGCTTDTRSASIVPHERAITADSGARHERRGATVRNQLGLDWESAPRAIREAISWSPAPCRRAELPNPRARAGVSCVPTRALLLVQGGHLGRACIDGPHRRQRTAAISVAIRACASAATSRKAAGSGVVRSSVWGDDGGV